jgi:monomeric sarcosine oxidase
MKIAVCGAGGVGSAAARFLAREGHEVHLLEQFNIDHDRGSSYGESRIIRKTYPDRLYTQLMTAAYPLWEELEKEAGESLFVRCGGLTFGKADNADLLQTEDALKAANVPYEWLETDASNARFPGLKLLKGERAIYQADSGFLRASSCVKAQIRLAVEHGARLIENIRLIKIHPESQSVHLETSKGDLRFERLLLCAGPWLPDLFPMAAPVLKVTRQQYVYLKAKGNAEPYAPERFPVWINCLGESRGDMYGFPSDGRIAGVKFALHEEGLKVHPDQVDRKLDPTHAKELLAYAAERLPGLTQEILHDKTCLYTNTPDHHFLIEPLKDIPGAFYIGGLSGHGFKFTVLLGRIGADAVTGRPSPYDLSRFRLSRILGS